MLKQFFSGKLNIKAHFNIFKNLLLICNTTSLVVYCAIHLILFDLPIDPLEEITNVIKLLFTSGTFAVAISLVLLLADASDYLFQHRKAITFPNYAKAISVTVVALIVFLSACHAQIPAGVKKDAGTGLSASYSNMKPEKVFLLMNKEVLNHTDIPIGESFLLVNDGINGLVAKNGKVTVGCSLKITDSKGKILMNEKDLFAGHDTFEEKDAKMLKCTITTGEPMKWEEKYNVTVIFWDKNGKGRIENKVTIRIIDLP